MPDFDLTIFTKHPDLRQLALDSIKHAEQVKTAAAARARHESVPVGLTLKPLSQAPMGLVIRTGSL